MPNETEVGFCSDLMPNQRCIRLWKYNSVGGDILFHKHVAKARMSSEACRSFMIALLVRELDIPRSELYRGYLNKRKGRPSNLELFEDHISYPQNGVIRKSIDAFHLSAFVDEYLGGMARNENPDQRPG